MSSSYELWLTDDAGRRIALLNMKSAFFSYSRTTNGYGTIQAGFPFQEYKKLVPNIFQMDWRLDVWRSPGKGFSKRREGSFWLLKFNIYRREDGMEIIEFLGRSPLEILRRIDIVDAAISTITADYADDAMKGIVSYYKDNVSYGPTPYTGVNLTSTGELTVDDESSLGPIISKESFQARKALDVISEIRDVTFQMNSADASNRKIYFDVVEGPGLPGGFGYIFRTFANLRGKDRTGSGLVFSVENGNLKDPTCSEDYFDIETVVMTFNNELGEAISAKQSDDRYISRWANIHKSIRISSTDTEENNAECYRELEENKAKKSINCTFLNTPGGPSQPRSLYGVDWDFGDLVRAQFAGKTLDAEIKIVYVAVDDQGKETITARNEVGAV